ncbi:MAG TPA: SpoIVB peptidase [Oscillospiraceae bacterium]|nr:SpoIVB peptidase [Oscillospiraceae bacterium]
MKKLFKALFVICVSCSLVLAAAVGTISYFTPDSYQVTAGKSLGLDNIAVTAKNTKNDQVISAAALKKSNQNYQAKLMLLNTIPIKTVNISVIDENWLIPCGTPFGIKMFTNGVVIVGVADIKTATGVINPAAVAGLKVGDVIVSIDGKAVNQNEEVADIIEKSNGKSMKFLIHREKAELTAILTPVKSATDDSYKGGLWVRDSTAGIGTVTFYNPTTCMFGGLGHGISDQDTNELLPLRSGDIVNVTISGIIKGEKGMAGELRGYFNNDTSIGNVDANVEEGVYGSMQSPPTNNKAVKVAMKQEVKTGPAQILTTIDGNTPQYYDVQIESINYRDNVRTKNMVVRITDKKLLEATGGIIQGMSGSPIIQNNMLVGAVTHVFVNDPTRGYGIFAENMLTISQSINKETMKKAS